jgi:hypothetical protein
MHSYRTDIYIFFSILILCSAISLASGGSVIDVQLYDTYIVVPRYQLMLILVSIVTFFVFLIRCLLTRFKILSANIFFGFGCFIFAYCAWRIGQLLAVLGYI